MKTFKIEIKELVSKTIEVEAESYKEAVIEARKYYYDDFLINEKKKLIDVIIEYLYKDEEKHYEEFEENDKPEDHIYLTIKKLQSLNNPVRD